ncbi:hypothetical protein BKA93DRAFT_282238 [Sparassis latifolia]
MSPSRKRPVCHSCGSPMAGHKRPNGIPVCPTGATPPPILPRGVPLRRTNAVFQIPENGHYINPNYVESEVAQTADDDDDGSLPSSWVPTEPADDNAHPRHGEFDGDDDARSNTSTSVGSSVSSRIRRSLSELLMTSTPLASLFSTPKDNLPALAKAAHRRGLFMGLIQRRGKTDQGGRIKIEESDGFGAGEMHQHPRLVVMGRDPRAVEYLLDISEEETDGQVGPQGGTSGQKGLVGTYPIDIRSIRMTFLDVILAGAIGGLVVWYGLSIL